MEVEKLALGDMVGIRRGPTPYSKCKAKQSLSSFRVVTAGPTLFTEFPVSLLMEKRKRADLSRPKNPVTPLLEF